MSRKKRARTGTAAVMAFSALVLACGGGETTSDPLAGTSWQLQDYADPANPGGMTTVLGAAIPTLEFGADSTVHGTGGCNNYRGAYALQGDSLTFGPLASTMMYCGEEEGVMDQETAFVTQLQSAAAYKLEDGRLHILDSEGTLLVLLTAR